MGWDEYASALEPHTKALTALLAAVLVTILFLRVNWDPKPVAASERAQKGKKVISKSEVANHNRANDVWIILKGKVYDVSSYVEEHPGGAAILNHAGGDSSEGFYGPQHPERVFDLIDDFYIGDLET